MYKSFLWGIAKIARSNNGELRSFNGDGVLIVFAGDLKRTQAAKAALQMSWFCKYILRPKISSFFENNDQLKNMDFTFGIGIDVGKILVVRGGIKGENNNDLVWVGNATNHAVKFSSIIDEGYSIFMSDDVYKNMYKTSKYEDSLLFDMWERRNFKGIVVYRTNYFWKIR